MSDLLDVEQVRAMATPAGALWAGERAPTALALARTALEWFARWSTVHAAEEARDLAVVERDEAYKQRDEAFARADDGRHEVQRVYGALRGRLASRLNVSISEPDEAILDAVDARAGMKRERDTERGIRLEREAALAEVRAEVPRLQSDRDAERGLRLALESQINDARAILGAAAGDLLSDAAERAACAVQHEANAMDIIGRALGRKVVGGADVAAIHASEEIERLRERVAELEAAGAESPQVFRPPISVTIHHVTGHAFAEVEVGDVTDPAFLALPMGVRLGLVVCDE